jgi:hypothetical protein
MNIALLNKVVPRKNIQQLRAGKRYVQILLSDFTQHPPIFVYSMPKSGTSTIWKTLEAITPRHVYKLHRLSDEGLKLINERESLSRNKQLIDINKVSSLVRRKIDHTPNVRWDIVTSTREPISQAISGLFQGIDVHHPYLINEQGTVDVDKAMQSLTKKFSEFDENRDPEKTWYSIVWFDWELKRLFDIDVYASPFRHEQGYMIFENLKARVLLIRAEDLNHSLNPGLSEFLGVNDSFEMKQANLGSKKDYLEEQAFYDAYKYIKSNFKVSRDICEKIYSTKYARHFYSEQEREQFIQKWSV